MRIELFRVVRILGGREDADEGEIGVMVPYWVYRKFGDYLAAVKSPQKVDDFIVSLLVGHAERLQI